MERSKWLSAMVVAGIVALAAPSRAEDKYDTACTALDICYCVNTKYLDAIKTNVDRLRKLIKDNRESGKAIGYLSVPISPAGGGDFAVNIEAGRRIAADITRSLGMSSVLIINPGADGGDGMAKASGADYMYMWTQVLEGPTGHGEDFDFFYFAGPTDFSRYFLNKDDKTNIARQDVADYLGKLDAFFDQRMSDNAGFEALPDKEKVQKKVDFRKYYGLRASVAFSFGSHDEWNIARVVNERRRGAAAYGIANQLAIFFDGAPVNPGGYESAAASGDTGRCIK